MILPPLSRDAVRNVDRRAIEHYGLPGIVLMENAGRGAVDLLEHLGVGGPVVICAGKGNNGGDGFVMARHLELRGHTVRLLLFCEPGALKGDAAVNYQVLVRANAAGRVVRPSDLDRLDEELAAADWIVDALLGTGTRGEAREPFASVIPRINAAGKKVFAVDLPSGLDCDSGQPLGPCVRAEHTASFVSRKIGFDSAAALQYTGEVHVVEIGVPLALLAEIAGQPI